MRKHLAVASTRQIRVPKVVFFNFVNLLGEISDLPYVGGRDISYGTILERKKGRGRKRRKEGAIDRSVCVVYKFLIVYIITR